jgi:flagellar M-ring protein FliF
MDWRQFENLFRSLKGLGRKRLIALGGAGVFVFALISIGSYFASSSSFETLYVGLTPPDVSRMGSVLSEAGIPFETSLDGKKLGVPMGQAAQARALLAEKGLPGSPNAGYELFDKLGALGLTSFMQHVTRVRALEGELARTIQYLKGIRAARVHLVLPDRDALSVKKQTPSASVVIRTDVPGDATAAPAIKHLVAAAIPEMTPNEVQVIGADGTLLSGGDEAATNASARMLELEHTVAQQIQESVKRTLAPYLGLDNFQVSAVARLNLDQHQQTETKYDPDSKVERSTRTVKEEQSSQAGSGDKTVSVEQNVPGEENTGQQKDQSKQARDRKEETTNYEISSTSASTVSQGYKISNISVAVVVNKKRLMEILGKDAKPSEIDKQVAQIQKLALSAAGLDTDRGDRINVAAVDFAPQALSFESGAETTTFLMKLASTGLKSLTILLLAGIVIMAGFRPAMRMLLTGSETAAIDSAGKIAALTGPSGDTGDSGIPIDMPEMASPLLEPGANPFDMESASAEGAPGAMAGMSPEFASGISGLSFGRSLALGPVEKLSAIIERDEEQAAAVLKHWVKNG